MRKHWEEVQISEVCEIIVDCVNKTAPKVDYETPYKMIRTTNVRNGNIDLSDCKFVTKDTFEKWTRRAFVMEGDIILTREAPMGEVGIIKETDTIFLGQRLMQYRVNPKKINNRFLLYSFLSPALKHQFFMHEGSGSVVSHIRVPDCSKFILKLPSLPVQKSIAHILGTLDDKIHLNRQINATLESMAQALFQSWFVLFDPVIDNALAEGNPIPEPLHGRAEARKALGEGRKSLPETVRGAFPSRFVFSEEMGWIPEGWGVSTVGEEVETIGGGTPSTKNDEFWVGGEHCFCTPKDMSKLNSITLLDTERKLTDAGVNKISSGKLPSGTVLMSSRAPIGYLAISDASVSVNQGIIAMLPNERYSAYYLLLWSKFNMRQIKDRANGSTFQEISKKNFRPIPFLVPDFDIMDFFSKYVDGFLSEIKLLEENTQSLVRVRDTLLPKLLSGELEIEEIGTFSTKGKNK